MKKVLFLLMILSSVVFAKHLNYESHYQKIYCDSVGGVTEHVLPDRARVDCLTDRLAVEVDFSEKWGECIGQALLYGVDTNRKPACLLIMEDPVGDIKHLKRLQRVADRYSIKVITIDADGKIVEHESQ